MTKEQEITRLQTIYCNMAYQDELDNKANLTDEDIKKGVSEIKNHLTNNLNDIPYYILENNEFLRVLAIIFYKNQVYSISELEYKDVLQRYEWYLEGFNFFNDSNAFKILEIYGDIIKRDSNGFYEVNDTIVNKVISDNGFYINGDKSELKSIIFDTWENQKEILTNDTLNTYSEQRNGINFKHFIFCEEYIKRGKIKPTCDYLGISRNTAYLWLKDDKVQQYLKDRQDEITRDTDNTFKNTYNECFNELHKMINSEYMQNDDKIKAISTFLKHYENMQRLKQPLTSYED